MAKRQKERIVMESKQMEGGWATAFTDEFNATNDAFRFLLAHASHGQDYRIVAIKREDLRFVPKEVQARMELAE